MKAETKLRVAACAAGFALPRYNDLPSVGLYLDQTVQFVNGYFRSFCGGGADPIYGKQLRQKRGGGSPHPQKNTPGTRSHP